MLPEMDGLKALVWLSAIMGVVIVALAFTPRDSGTSVTVMIGFTSSVATSVYTLIRMREGRLAAEAEASRVKAALEKESARVKTALAEHSEGVRENFSDLKSMAQENKALGLQNHRLLNGGLGVVLERYALKSEEAARLDPTEANIKEAQVAREVSDRHGDTQLAIDKEETTREGNPGGT